MEIKLLLEFLFGIALLPVAGGFVAFALADPNISGLMGMTLILPLAMIALAFVVIYDVVKQIKK